MPRSRVPVRGSIGKSIRTGGSSTTVNSTTVVQQTVKGTVSSGGGGISSTIWPLVQQIPPTVLDIAALTTTEVGVLSFNGTDVISAPLTTAQIPTLPASKISSLATVATTGLYSSLTGKPTIPADISGLTYATVADETADAPNSSQLIAGTNITFDTSTPNQLKIDATGGGGSSPLTTKGDLYGYNTADARIPVGSDGTVLTADSTNPLGVSYQPAAGTGTVTSVGIKDLSSVPIYAVSTTPITTLGTLDITLLTQSATKVFAGPISGSAAQPTFRSLVSTDIPGLALAGLTDVTISSVSSGQVLTFNGTKWVNENGGSGPSPSAPALISDLIYWLQSDIVATHTGSSGQVPVMPNSLPWWNGDYWVRGGTLNALKGSTLNSLGVIALAGGEHYIPPAAGAPYGSNGGAILNECTIFAVFKTTSAVGSSFGQSLISGVTGIGGMEFRIGTSGNLTFSDQSTAASGTTGVISNGTWYQVNGQYSSAAGTYAFRVARSAAGSGSGGTLAISKASNGLFFYNPNAALNLDFVGSCAELIVYDRYLSGTEITAVETYLNSKWGV